MVLYGSEIFTFTFVYILRMYTYYVYVIYSVNSINMVD